jgi:myosin-1
MAEPTDDVQRILEKVQTTPELSRGELNILSHHFTPDSSDQAKAYLALSLLCQNARDGRAPPSATDQLQRTLEPVVTEDLVETDDVSLVRGISFLTAIFHVDAEVATVIFTREGTLEAIMDAVNVSSFTPLALSVARLLAEASGHKKCRAILPPTTRQWLENQSRRGKDDQLAVACGVARVKLWQTSFADAAADGADPEEQSQTSVEDLVSLMQGIVVSEGVGSGVVEAVEGLAYLSTDPDMKERLSKDQNFLKHLFALIPDRKKRKSSTTNPPTLTNSPLLYGVITIIANLIGYRPMLSEEQRQIERLSQMSKTTQGTTKATKGDSKLNDDAQVKTRVRRLIDAGLLPILSALPSLTDSQGVHRNVARAFLSLTEDKDIRGLVLQAGGSKALQLIIRHLPPPPPVSVKKAASKPPLPAPLEAIQALAKLSITSSPLQVYGADVGPIHDALRPLSLLVLDSSANQLQQFEGAMALTNLASISPDFCSRIADLDGFLNKVELLLFEDHVLLRRAAMELICNLVAGSDKTFERYAGADGSSGIKSKLHLVLAICDVEDIPTRLAASGTLATLMNSPSACRTLFDLQMEKGRFLPIMIELVQPISVGAGEAEAKEDAGLIHRAMVCVLNFLTHNPSIKMKELGVKYPEQITSFQAALVNVVKRREQIPLPDPVLQIVLQTAKAVVALSK